MNLHIITKISEANGERRVWIGHNVDVSRVFAICISVLFLSLPGKYFISTKIVHDFYDGIANKGSKCFS